LQPERFEIEEIRARQILDCRGDPTVQVEVLTKDRVLGRADVPQGRSTGSHEAFVVLDNGREFNGRGVHRAVRNVTDIIGPALKGFDVRKQREIDRQLIRLDGTENKSRLGANAIVGVSLAVARTAANALAIPLYSYVGGAGSCVLPVPFLNYVNGGKLSATDLDFQEHFIIPVGAKSFSEALRKGVEVYHKLGQILSKKYSKYVLNTAVEGGYTPPMTDPRDAFDAELKAIEELGYAGDFVLGLDCAATHLYDKKRKKYTFMGKLTSREKLMDLYDQLTEQYPIVSIEDPLEEEDFEGFKQLTQSLGIQIIGDDLFVTNVKRLKKGIETGAANALLWKVNQVGTLSEAVDAANMAFRNGYGVQVSERSGQTEDTWLADLTVALNAGQIKTGAPCRSERVAQYNRLLQIEEELGKSARYPGKHFRKPV
jgi:enolase